MEIRAVHVVEGRAPAGHRRLGERHPAQERAALPVARVQRVRDDADGAERLGEPQAVQDLDGVGAEREARAHLAQDAGLLVDVDVEAGLAQGEGGGQAADPGADDEHAHGPARIRTRDLWVGLEDAAAADRNAWASSRMEARQASRRCLLLRDVVPLYHRVQAR